MGRAHLAHHRADPFVVAVGRVAREIQRARNVGRAVVKPGEQKAQLRRGNDPIHIAAMERIVLIEIAQSRLGQLHRANGAQNIGKHLVARVLVHLLAAVAHPHGYIICIVQKQDQIIAFHFQRIDHCLVKRFHRFLFAQRAIAQRHEQRMLRAFHHLIRRKNPIPTSSWLARQKACA